MQQDIEKAQKELDSNKEKYVSQMKEYPNIEGNIIVQYGGGNMMKPGSYDRYTPFRNNPDADFLVIASRLIWTYRKEKESILFLNEIKPKDFPTVKDFFQKGPEVAHHGG